MSGEVHKKTKAVIALLLTFSAGSVDVVGYLAIYDVFTAHMTGNTVHLAHNIMIGDWQKAAAAAAVIAAFLAGSILGRAIIEIGVRTSIRSIASAALILEGALIAAVGFSGFAFGALPTLAALAMLAAAMGMQTATLTRIGSLTVHTTFVTGMLNKLAQLISQALFLSHDLRLGRDVRAGRQKVLREMRFIGSIWLLYLVGAGAGAWMNTVWNTRSLLLPIALVVTAIIVDQVTPLSIEEEQEGP